MTTATGSQIVKNADLPEMVERVARAIFDTFPEPLELSVKREHLWELSKAAYEMRARAAISAMVEPTEEMISAGMKEAAVDLASEYRAMIQAALGDDAR